MTKLWPKSKIFSKRSNSDFSKRPSESGPSGLTKLYRVHGPPCNPPLLDQHHNHKKNNSQAQSANILYRWKNETKAIHTFNQLVIYHIETVFLGLPYERS